MSKKKGTEVKEARGITIQGQPVNEVSLLIEKAIENQLPVETMERLFALSREVKADNAREAFVQALARFQEDCPIIKKTKSVMNKDGRTIRYSYAPLDSVIEQVRNVLHKNGFAYTWDSLREDEHIKVICKLTHNLGHSEQSTFDIPIVKSEYMSSPQTYATAQSYAKRYTLLNVLGIGTADEDNDAQDTDRIQEAKDPKARIIFLLRRLGVEAETKEEYEAAIKDKTKLVLAPRNFKEIISRLEIMISEKQGL